MLHPALSEVFCCRECLYPSWIVNKTTSFLPVFAVTESQFNVRHNSRWDLFICTFLSFHSYMGSLEVGVGLNNILKGKGICLKSRYPCDYTYFSDFTSPGSGRTAACNHWSNLGSVYQVPITAGWTEVVWNMKFAWYFYTWPALDIRSAKCILMSSPNVASDLVYMNSTWCVLLLLICNIHQHNFFYSGYGKDSMRAEIFSSCEVRNVYIDFLSPKWPPFPKWLQIESCHDLELSPYHVYR